MEISVRSRYYVFLPRCQFDMSACFPSGSLTFISAIRGRIAPSPVGVSLGVFRHPTDPIGTHALTLTNVVVGSRVHIEDQAGTTTLYDQIAASSTVSPTLQVYAAGSALNNWRIRIRKASAAPYYIPYETLMTATVGASSIYVSQIPDQ